MEMMSQWQFHMVYEQSEFFCLTLLSFADVLQLAWARLFHGTCCRFIIGFEGRYGKFENLGCLIILKQVGFGLYSNQSKQWKPSTNSLWSAEGFGVLLKSDLSGLGRRVIGPHRGHEGYRSSADASCHRANHLYLPEKVFFLPEKRGWLTTPAINSPPRFVALSPRERPLLLDIAAAEKGVPQLLTDGVGAQR